MNSSITRCCRNAATAVRLFEPDFFTRIEWYLRQNTLPFLQALVLYSLALRRLVALVKTCALFPFSDPWPTDTVSCAGLPVAHLSEHESEEMKDNSGMFARGPVYDWKKRIRVLASEEITTASPPWPSYAGRKHFVTI